MAPVFITGGTGYLGRPLIRALIERRFEVHALVRPGSESKIPAGAAKVVGDALDERTFASAVPAHATFVHLVGTPHPSPSKAAEFQHVDLASIRAAVAAAERAKAGHFVYVSVAHPAPIMHAYVAVRQEGESLIRATAIPSTILRPWYVLGPGHRWPYLLVPVYAVMRRLPSTRESAIRLGLVSHRAMVAALLRAVEAPPAAGQQIVDVPGIRSALAR